MRLRGDVQWLCPKVSQIGEILSGRRFTSTFVIRILRRSIVRVRAPMHDRSRGRKHSGPGLIGALENTSGRKRPSQWAGARRMPDELVGQTGCLIYTAKRCEIVKPADSAVVGGRWCKRRLRRMSLLTVGYEQRLSKVARDALECSVLDAPDCHPGADEPQTGRASRAGQKPTGLRAQR